MDCDGVLTDGRLYFSASGESLKVFNVRDGQGIADWHKAGFVSGIISGRDAAEIVGARARELGMKYVKTGSRDKVADLTEILKDADASPEQVAYVGDDVGDVELMKVVGFPVAVADAVSAAKSTAVYVTLSLGGHGAIREVTDLILKAKLFQP